MRVIELNASNWCEILDLHNALKTALASPEWHGSNMNAWVDSIIYGGINGIAPPYLIRIIGTSNCGDDLKGEINLLASAIEDARQANLIANGENVDVRFELKP